MTAPTPEQREAARRLVHPQHGFCNSDVSIEGSHYQPCRDGTRAFAQALADAHAAGRREGIDEAVAKCRVVEAQRMAQAQEMRWKRSRVASDYCRAMTAGVSEARSSVRALLDAPAGRGGGEAARAASPTEGGSDG